MHDTAQVARILRLLVRASEASERRPLTDQIDRLTEARGPLTMISLTTTSALETSIPDGPLPVRAFVLEGERPTGELLLWMRGGIVDTLEYAWLTDDPPTTLPDTADIRIAEGRDPR